MKSHFTIGTRGSQLALVQAESVRNELQKQFSDYTFSTQKIQTAGDIEKTLPIGELNLKGAFTKALDDALLEKRIDLAVHSLKDLPSELPKGVILKTVTSCLDARDVLVSKSGSGFWDLPEGSLIGTSSLRRGALVRILRPELKVKLLRGNVDTRLRKLREGEFDAILLAAAGITRLKRAKEVTEYLKPTEFVPAIGQGRLAVVIRVGDEQSALVARVINDCDGYKIAVAERRFMARMEGGCQVPLGCYGEVREKKLHLVGFLSTPDASRSLKKEAVGSLDDGIRLADDLADKMLGEGGKEILETIQQGAKSGK